ncbi:hypothetical protein MHYP_G00029770 [Metynnis hypsauchen]
MHLSERRATQGSCANAVHPRHASWKAWRGGMKGPCTCRETRVDAVLSQRTSAAKRCTSSYCSGRDPDAPAFS